MKKVFWTSIVWIILFWWFALYMKWFNQPLAKTVTDSDVCTKVFDQLDKIEKKLSGTTTEKSTEELYEEFKTWYESKE